MDAIEVMGRFEDGLCSLDTFGAESTDAEFKKLFELLADKQQCPLGSLETGVGEAEENIEFLLLLAEEKKGHLGRMEDIYEFIEAPYSYLEWHEFTDPHL